MTNRTDQLEAWWRGLSDEQRALALTASSSDDLDETIRLSLEEASLLRPGQPDDKDQVDIFLKTRH